MVEVGMMRMKLQYVLGGALMLAAFGCSSAGVTPDDPSSPVRASAVSGESVEKPVLTSIRSELVPSPRLVFNTTQHPSYTSYSPQADVFVVDLPSVTRAAGLEIPSNLPPIVASLAAEEVFELGTPITRITVRLTGDLDPSVSTEGKNLVISLGETDPVAIADEPAAQWGDDEGVRLAEPVVTSEALPTAEPVVPILDEPLEDSSEPAIATVTEPRLVIVPDQMASNLLGVKVETTSEGLVVKLRTDGRVDYKSFTLPDPARIVVDLNGLVNRSERSVISTGSASVQRVRVAQFSSDPDPVARVVLDLKGDHPYTVRQAAEGLEVVMSDAARPVRTMLASEIDTDLPATRVAPKMTAADLPREAPEDVFRVSDAAGVEQDATHLVYAPQTVREPEPPPQERPIDTSVIRSTVEQEPVDDVFQQGVTPGATVEGGTVLLPGESREVGAMERIFTGEPIDITFTNADLIDVLRLFSEITGLNIAIDPEVRGTVTVRFEGVPWDQALDLILRQNDLTYTYSGNVMRIGTINRLTAEAVRTRELAEEERNNVPLRTVIKYLSYARAPDVQSILSALSTPRGTIIVDARTNQLIISEVPDVLQTMFDLIETIDVATPQVMIEARIVETTKNFARQLGITWGFNGTLDPALGTGTGLTFPNRVDVTGGPFDFGAGNPVLDLSFMDVLGTFDLDVLLTAAESEGLVKVVSAPKVTTQDNQAAEIQSGVQIPVQTRVNFTTTVTYIDATLRLSVTPQVTAVGTVIMDIQVQKTEPALGLTVVGGTNSPLITRRAQTKLMVRDGGTTVIGGIYQATDNNAQSRVPFLHQIPVLGNLFKNNDISSRHDELLIFITPRIVRVQ